MICALIIYSYEIVNLVLSVDESCSSGISSSFNRLGIDSKYLI